MKPYAYLKNVSWLPAPSRLELFLSETQNFEMEKVSAVFCFVFTSDNKLLLVQHSDGTLGLPGGGREAGESAAAAVAREVREETNATIKSLQLIGWQKVTVNAPVPTHNRRPWPEFYELFYSAVVDQLLNGTFEHETTGRVLVPLGEAAGLEAIQYQYNRILFQQALLNAHNIVSIT